MRSESSNAAASHAPRSTVHSTLLSHRDLDAHLSLSHVARSITSDAVAGTDEGFELTQ